MDSVSESSCNMRLREVARGCTGRKVTLQPQASAEPSTREVVRDKGLYEPFVSGRRPAGEPINSSSFGTLYLCNQCGYNVSQIPHTTVVSHTEDVSHRVTIDCYNKL